jgi:membrane protease YdiL (CAAX protease family)
VNSPQFDLGPAQQTEETAPLRRNFVGWAVLILFFGLYVPLATYGAVSRQPEKAEKYAEVESQLKQAIAVRELSKLAPGRSPSMDLLDDAISNLVEPAKKDAEAASVYIALRREQGESYDRQYLEVLRKSREDSHRAFAEVYGSEKLTADQAAKLSARLKGDRFLYKLARAEAQLRAGNPRAKKELVPASRAVITGILLLAAGLVFVVGVTLWISYPVLRSAGKLPALGMPVGNLDLPTADAFALRAAQLIGLFFAIPLLMRAVAGVVSLRPKGGGAEAFGNPIVGILAALLIIAATLALTMIPVSGVDISLRRLGIDAKNFGQRVLWALSGWAASLPALLVALLVGLALFRFLPAPQHPATEMLRTTQSPLAIAALFIMASIQAPIFEEILFRGVLFPALSSVLRGPVAGAVASSFLFASIHPQGPAAWLGLATIGAMNCFLTYQTRSLVPAMILHAVHNAATLTLGLVVLG